MSCMTSREMAGPAGGSVSAAEFCRELRSDSQDQKDGVFDSNGNISPQESELLFDCNCNVRRSRFWDMDWGYSENNGPSTWAVKYPLAAGPRQSPVDLPASQNVPVQDHGLKEKPLRWRYSPQGGCILTNTGYGWKVQIDGPNSELSGGPLTNKYRLEQFHMHWGDNDNQGSEHTVEGKSYAGELHLVHWNCEKYSSFAEAASKPDGLAVLGVFLQVGAPMPELQKVTDRLGKVSHKGDTIDIDEDIDPTAMLPSKKEAVYWTYLGSLTTPPCNESVIWIVFKEPVTVSEQQLGVMRTLRCYEQSEACPCDENRGLLTKNFRPPLPLGNRLLRQCGE